MSIDSNYERKNQRINKNLLNFAIISFLVISNFLIGEYLREDTMNKIMWPTDDPIAISTARSYELNGDFKVHFLRAGDFSFFTESLPDAIKSRPSISTDYDAKGPVYSILLGDFYKLLGTTPKDLYFHGSIFSNLGTSAFLVAFFFLIKKYFNLKIAFFSSLLILTNSSFGWASSKVMSDSGLLFLFSVLALFFLEKKKSHYFLFGIFTGLSHLTHPFGIFLGSAYAIYLLIHREFKGFLLTVLGWHLVLLPWFVRNYYLYKDIGWGLWIPFSSKISYLISVVTHTENQVVGSNPISSSGIGFIGSVEPFQTFIGMLIDEANDIWFISFLLIFIFFIIAFAFIKIEKLKINKKFWLLGLVGILYVLVYYFHNVYLQIVFSFVVPIILVYLLYRKNKTIFETSLPRLYYFIIFFAFINLIYYYVSTSVVERTIPEIREVIFAVFTLTPLALFGIEKLIQQVETKLEHKLKQEKSQLDFDKSKVIKKNMFLKIMPVVIMGLIILPMIIQMSEGLAYQHSFVRHNWPEDNNSIRAINEWINSNVHDQNIASNSPGYSYSKTGLDSVPIPTLNWSQIDIETFLVYYDVSYVVFYSPSNFPIDNSLYDTMMNWPKLSITYSEIYANGNSHVIKITHNISSSIIDEPISYIQKGYLMEVEGLKDNATKIYDKILNFGPTNIVVDEKLCNGFLAFHKFDYAIKKCGLLLKKDETNVIALSNLAISYEKTGQKENLLDILEKYKTLIIKDPENQHSSDTWINLVNTLIDYDKQYKKIIIQNLLDILEKYKTLIIKDPENQSLLHSWTNLMNTLIGYDEQYKTIVVDLFGEAMHLEEKGYYQKALNVYKRIQGINGFGESSIESQIRVLTKSKQFDNSLITYDSLIKYIEDEMKNSKNYTQLQQTLKNTFAAKAQILINLHKYDDAADAYLEIEKLDMFDKNAHQQRAHLLEQSGDLAGALREYQFLNHVEPDNQEFVQKISNLTTQINK